MSFSFLSSLPMDHFQCSICLNVFTNPVTTPCGHNFCKTCISEHWHSSDLCQCPTCHKRFHVRPEMSTNTIIEEISVHVKRRKLELPESPEAESGVMCEICTGIKFKAQKSCLVCLTSYCTAHLEPHHRVPSLMRHTLIEPVENLEERTCKKHQRILEMFCKEENVCICLLCIEMDHKNHDIVPIKEEGNEQKKNIQSKNEEIQMLVEQKKEKINDLMRVSEERSDKAKKEIDLCNNLFTKLMSHVEETQAKLKSYIEEKIRKSQAKDEAMIQELKEEITQLERKQSQLEELAQSEDHLHILQSLQALCNHSDMKDWSQVRIYSDICVQTVRTAMSHLVGTFQSELKSLTKTELTRMREFKELVTFDPNTAGPLLCVYDSGQRIKHIKTARSPTDNQERFDRPMVLGTKGFNSGRHYWEAQVGVRCDWDVGVAVESVDRKDTTTVNEENGFFAIGKRGSKYEVHCKLYKQLYLNLRPRNIGIYVDYEKGRVSFYDVDNKIHIYSFVGLHLTEKLFPYFYLYSWAKKSEPLAIELML
ncbi:E3 ubiquitin-protein ligase TRIM41-like [Thalassophryne amazonica]|uniref:E3 ubiquitin-protein ligase TRIM41-like n=1 Tax=Thalassophryne amazonica TaxID=390379 RepID=UPI0014715E2C|nr:E3 ubiquitin-protein ligase TRIM41-like [Thalassophryne amazonica]